MSLFGTDLPDSENKRQNLKETQSNTCSCLLSYCFVPGSVTGPLGHVSAKPSLRPVRTSSYGFTVEGTGPREVIQLAPGTRPGSSRAGVQTPQLQQERPHS